MGCGFSRRVVPNSSGDPGAGGEIAGSFVGDEVATAGANAANAVIGGATKDSPLSFVVPIRDTEGSKEGSIIRRHPPVRLRRLEEEQQLHRPKLTLGALERRQAEAEERRRKILDSRVQSAQHFQRKVLQGTGTVTASTSPSDDLDRDRDRDQEKVVQAIGERKEAENAEGEHQEELNRPTVPAGADSSSS
ncbi:uncharacterized protein LOC124182320 [Neodiprion fabricii]|uniref:uncharacterized protein LOC124182320 n=1 Tax=Neodiprion fabricii TaxID=2872261 RepID=UPI001ED97AC6|nr:uncharacterized protein LOC124182320 [Neodiprion fabricii]